MTVRTSEFDYEEALTACARGERFALRTLYERESRWLLGVIYRIVRDRQTAEDVLQDAFLQIWRSASTFNRERGSGRGWIYTVVRHRALQEVRRAGRDQSTPVDNIESMSDSQQTEPPSFDGPGSEELERCLEQLDPQKRDCIVQAFVEGFTHEQIASQMHTPLGTIKSWIRRGLVSLKECLS